MRTIETGFERLRKNIAVVASAVGISALSVSCGVANSESEAESLPAAAIVDSGINKPATVTKQAERLSMGDNDPSATNGLSLVESYNSNFITDSQIRTECVSRNPVPGFYFNQVFYYIDGISNNPGLNPGGFVKYNFTSSDSSYGFGGEYPPNPSGGSIVIEFGTSYNSADEASRWSGTSTFSLYNQTNIGAPENSVPTSVFRTNINCPLAP